MKHLLRFVLAGVVLAILAQPAVAQDLTGTWNLQLSTDISGATRGDIGGIPCEYEGVAEIVDNGGALSGTADLSQSFGDRACPPELSGTLTGTSDGTTIDMGIMTDGDGGTATFSGVLGAPERGAVTPGDASGGMNVTGGTYAGATGTWTAQFAGLTTATDIPTVGVLGLTALTLFLLLAGFVVLRR